MTSFAGGVTVNHPRAIDLVAVALPGSHVGTSAVTFSVPYRGVTITVYAAEPFHADGALQAFIGSLAPQYSGAITWAS